MYDDFADSYLTNTDLSNKTRCEWAAEKSGMKVIWCDHPMPADADSYDDEGYQRYFPEKYVGHYGSIRTLERGKDHGPFWRKWEEYNQIEIKPEDIKKLCDFVNQWTAINIDVLDPKDDAEAIANERALADIANRILRQIEGRI